MAARVWSDLRYRLRALFRREEVERELDEELRYHLEREEAKLRGEGHAPEQAAREARLRFGGIERTKEQSRDGRGVALVEQGIGRAHV